jgi:L-fuculose-phosphate aldolase
MRFEETREQVVRTCIELADQGYLAGTGGNVALRADADHFAVTPSATDYYAMTAADVCVARLADAEQVDGERTASVEAGLHAGVLRARPECWASVHTHQPVASAYTLLAKPLDVRDSRHRALLGARVPCVGYAPSGTSILAARVARAVKPDVHAYLMRNHGAVCVGKGADEAMRRVAALEAECAAFFESHASNESAPLDASVRGLILDALHSAVDRETEETVP